MGALTVLVVDDSPLIRQVVADAFRAKGYAILSAGDGAEALRVISRTRPDLIIADILMPVMDGWCLCEEVRQSPITADIPFVFLTSEQEVRKRVRGLRLGADDYLTKPFSPEELLARAERLLVRAESVRALASAARDSLSGCTQHLSIADLLQILSLNGRTGALRLESVRGDTGRIYFKEGKIIQAEIGAVEGEKALFRLMMWSDSHFVLEDLPAGIPERIQGSTSSVLMEGFTHWDEVRDLADVLPSREACYRVAARVVPFIENVDLSAAERDVLAAVMAGLSLGEMLDALPHRDLDLYRAVLDLITKGFLEQPAEETIDTQPVPRPAVIT